MGKKPTSPRSNNHIQRTHKPFRQISGGEERRDLLEYALRLPTRPIATKQGRVTTPKLGDRSAKKTS